MPVTLGQFVQRLVEGGLFPADEIAAFRASLPAESQLDDAGGARARTGPRRQADQVPGRGGLPGQDSRAWCLGEYVVLDSIGAGGMGEVLKARIGRWSGSWPSRSCLAKEVNSPDSVKRFLREVQAAAHLIHPNIVTAYDAGEHQGIHYLVMEYVDGQDLAAVVKQHGPLPVDEAVDCTLQAARGLPTPTARVSSTATSSPATCSWTSPAR